jgi:TatD DNase family protein
MIDTHCHLNMAAFDVDRPQVLARALSNGITGLVVPAIHPQGWLTLLNWPRKVILRRTENINTH